jgi:hypothetical protein
MFSIVQVGSLEATSFSFLVVDTEPVSGLTVVVSNSTFTIRTRSPLSLMLSSGQYRVSVPANVSLSYDDPSFNEFLKFYNWTSGELTPSITVSLTGNLSLKAVYQQPPIGQEQYTYKISANAKDHEDYGLTYPVTYAFSIPYAQSNLVAYKRYSPTDAWQRVPERFSGETFSGIEAVRFDYAERKAYVSVAFSSWSDDIYVRVANSSDNDIPISYVGITDFYDNRRVAVSWTVDDIGQTPTGNDNYLQASQAFTDAKVWWTPGINTASWWWGVMESGNWSVYQTGINKGFTEMAAHSTSHSHVPYTVYSSYDVEIGGCKSTIINNLDLPYKKGSKEYVWAWIEPYGESDNIVQQKLGEYKYLVSRAVADPITGVWQGLDAASPWATWDAVNNHYGRAVPSIFLDARSLDYANAIFDKVYVSGGIYLVFSHIDQNWIPGGRCYEHLQHIKGHTDTWYVGFGQLYAYHYTQRVVTVTQIIGG